MTESRRPALNILLMLSLLAAPGAAQDWAKLEAGAVARLQEFFRIDTSNPPGNEKPAAEFFCRLLSPEGIECQLFEIAPGRANAYARLRGDGSKRPLILLNHTDVVQADPKTWSVPPFSGTIRDGAIYGRGAQDMKSEGMLQAMVMIALKRAAVPLARDIIFLAVADEEVGGAGTDGMVTNQRALIADAEYLINEGGENILAGEALPFWTVSVGEKIPFWLRLTARGRDGHGSRPRADSAPHRLARALARVVDYETPLRLLPLVQQIFCDLAAVEFPAEKEKFCNLEKSLTDPAFRKRLTENPDWNYMLRDTISLTVLRGGPQTNVIPAEASAELDIRLLPGSDADALKQALRRAIADDSIEIELMSPVRTPNASPMGTELWRVFDRVIARHHPGTRVTPRLSSGYTESQVYRELGIHAYGFSPFVSPPDEARTAHGTDERITVEHYKKGLRVLYDVVAAIAGR
jgi:acetylornithine deacetylase/succinyl-diaminopimelate desuccinylase-like protein